MNVTDRRRTTDRETTDGRVIAYSERETVAASLALFISKRELSSRSLYAIARPSVVCLSVVCLSVCL